MASVLGDIPGCRCPAAAAHESGACLGAVFAHATLGMVLSDMEGRFLAVNPAMQQMLGYSEEELRGKRFPDVTHPDDVALTRELSRELRTGQRERFRKEKRYIRKDGRVAWGHLTASLVRGPCGDPQFVIGMVEYITGRKQAEEELRTRASQQATIVELGRFALATSDLDALCQEAARLVAQTLDIGYCAVFELLPEMNALLLRAGVGWRDGLAGRATVEAEIDSAGQALLAHTPAIFASAPSATRRPVPYLLQEHGILSGATVIIPGRERPFGSLGAYETSPRTFMQDDIYFLQAIAHVLATAIERKAAEEEQAQLGQQMAAGVLQAQEEERSRIARDLHDGSVQTLSTMLVNLDLMEPYLPPDVDLRPIFEQVRSIARRALDETRALAHALRPMDLEGTGLVSAILRLAREYATTFDIAIDVQAEPWADTDLPAEIEGTFLRVVQEALANACKHSRSATVRVRLSRNDAAVRLLVEDEGAGFDPRQLPPPTAQGGLGLRGMRERAQLLGGELAVDTAPGKGTRLLLTVPVQSLRASPEQRSPAHRGTGTTVLLVDDHAMFREGVRAVLSMQPGVAIVGEAEDGHQAIRLVEALCPDIVLMDIAMPGLNGLDATRQIKRRFPRVEIIALTAHESREQLVQTVRVGAAACIVKRSAGTELVRAIQAVGQGQKYVSPAIAAMLLEDYQTRIDQDGDELLTEREREVLQLVAEGRTNHDIARQLVVSVKTVEGHRTKIMRKLGAHDRTDLVKYAIRMGMITPD